MNKSNKISYGIIIKNLRKGNNLSQTELGDLVGVSKSTISAYELDMAMPSVKTFTDICDVCHASIIINFNNKKFDLEKLSREF